MQGRLLTLVPWGESHGCCIGGVLVGAPPGLQVDLDMVNRELSLRRPGRRLTTPRREEDRVEILSGVYKGYTTGAPISFMIRNRDVDSSFYHETVRYKPRPGHSDLTARLYSEGFYDYRGGGFYSGRLTAVYVAAAALLRPLLDMYRVETRAYLAELGGVECRAAPVAREEAYTHTIYCPDEDSRRRMEDRLKEAIREGDSLGGIVEVLIDGLPQGLGDPWYRLDATLAQAILTIPAVKGVEFGHGFRLARMRGSEANEVYGINEGRITLERGTSGGLLGGHAAGQLRIRAVVKPTSTIRREQKTINWRSLEEDTITGRGRHDPAIALRAVPVVEAAASIIIADHLLAWTGRRAIHYHRLEHEPT
ncbi:MAG: chorismate synthase [Desulfurococcales archaeon]|nr:chorismate synthase [Desulfurococcales archaeon]